MAVRVVMPTFGLTEGEATIVRWLKMVGETVQIDEPLFEAESEKANLEVPAPQSGVLLHVTTAAGEMAPLGEVVAWIGESGEQVPGNGQAGNGQAGNGQDGQAVAPLAIETGSHSAEPPVSGAIDSGGTGRQIKASPIARRMAREHEVNLTAIQGSGPGGRIVEADILQFLKGREEAAKPLPAKPLPASPEPAADLLPLTALRRATAQRLSASARTTVPVPLFINVDMSEAQRLRQHTQAEYQQRLGTSCSYNAFVIRACAVVLPDYPALNGEWTESGVRVQHEVNIGLAVAVNDGLLVPVIQHADQKHLIDIQAEINQLIEQARDRNLSPQQLSNGTFTVTNLGNLGIDAFVPVINLPQTAILGVGRVADQVVVVEGQPAVRPLATLCLVFDHRATDGAPAAACLARIKQLLENPYLLA
jgi:pyruvate dehydrogenase E2 component (dihydrolipoamide acetyltransferase)